MYAITILRRAQKELSSPRQEPYIRVRDAIRRLAEEPRPSGSKKLAGREGWRIRTGSYRVVYEIDDHNHSVTTPPWYPRKVHASFQDALASLRRHLWGQRIISMFGKRLGHDKNLDVLLEALARAA